MTAATQHLTNDFKSESIVVAPPPVAWDWTTDEADDLRALLVGAQAWEAPMWLLWARGRVRVTDAGTVARLGDETVQLRTRDGGVTVVTLGMVLRARRITEQEAEDAA